MAVVVPVDRAHDLDSGVGVVAESRLVEQFALEGGEERLGHRVIEAIAFRAHRQHNASAAVERSLSPSLFACTTVESPSMMTTSVVRWNDQRDGGRGRVDRLSGRSGTDSCRDKQPGTQRDTCET